MGRDERTLTASSAADDENLLFGRDNLSKNLALSLRFFNDKPNSWNDVMRDKKNQKSFIKFVKTLATLNYGELMNMGNHYYTPYPHKTIFARGFNVSQAAKEQFKGEKIIGISPDGRNSSFRIFGYVTQGHFFVIWFDPQHKALP